jgi:hypothetical protein
MTIVLATYSDSDGTTDHEVFGPFADTYAADDWISDVDDLFNGPDGTRPATWLITKLLDPFTL